MYRSFLFTEYLWLLFPPPPVSAQVGIDLRSKRLLDRAGMESLAEERDRERPMSWEGELSDQETSNYLQMDDSNGHAKLKTEPLNDDDIVAMEGIQSVAPSSPMCGITHSDDIQQQQQQQDEHQRQLQQQQSAVNSYF